jgi:hypothetical protein
MSETEAGESAREKAKLTGSRRDLLDNIREGKNSVQEITSGPSKQD